MVDGSYGFLLGRKRSVSFNQFPRISSTTIRLWMAKANRNDNNIDTVRIISLSAKLYTSLPPLIIMVNFNINSIERWEGEERAEIK